MTEPLLHTKLMPPRIHSTVIPREGLLARMDDGLSKKLTLVSAPTGFGKTTLVSMWLANRKIPSAWISLDENDNDPVRFWTYVVTALRRMNAEIGKTALEALSTSSPSSYQTILTPLINDLAELSTLCVLVLEDYHAITNAEIHTALEFLLQNKPDHLHMLIISRIEPPLPLGILRARDELAEIKASDLRFTRADAGLFLQETIKGNLSPTAIDKLQERTEGWAAGLRLASLSLQNKEGDEAEQFIQTFSGSHRFIADYLIREVFAGQPQPIQDFLLKTCFLNRLSGALCDSIVGNNNGNAMLAQLERENLFLVQLETGHGRTWYRYSPLFAESMQTLARQRLDKIEIQSIFENASRWYADQQLFDDAIETALAAGLFESAVGLMERYIIIYSINEMQTLKRWVEQIPQTLITQHPAICMMYAQVILFTADRYAPATAARIEPYLNAAEQVWQAQGDLGKVGTALALRGMMLFWQGQLEQANEAVCRSLEMMPESEVFWRGVSLLNAAAGELYAGRVTNAQDQILEARAYLGASQNYFGLLAATGMLSDIFYAQGDLELCSQFCQQRIAEAVGDKSMLDDQGEARLCLSRVFYEQNDLDSALEYAGQAYDLGKQRGNEILAARAAGQLALIRFARSEFMQARADLKTQSAQMKNQMAIREIRTVELLLAVRRGETADAWLTSQHQSLPMQKEHESLILARQRIGEGMANEALEILQPILADAAACGRVRTQVEALCLAALAQNAGGNLSAAADSLAAALTIGREKGFKRVFLDEGVGMATLLQALVPKLADRALHIFISTLLHLFPAEMTTAPLTDKDSLTLIEPLSSQEVRVLKLLVAGQSNGEIARELVVSTNTIKTHVKSIYRKLNINSREEARTVVKELRLF